MFAKIWEHEFVLEKNPDALDSRWQLNQWKEGMSSFVNVNKAKIYPLLTPWDRYSNPKSFYENVAGLYSKGAKGIAVWDADMGLYKNAINLNL